MNKTLQVIRHELVQTVKRKGFIIMTLAFPVIALGAIGIYHLVQNMDMPEEGVDTTTTIGYVDMVGEFDNYTDQPGDITLVAYNSIETASASLLAEEVDAYIIIPEDYIDNGLIVRYTLEKELDPGDATRRAIENFLLSNLLEGKTSPELAERVKSPLWMSNIRLDETGEIAEDQGGFGAFIVPVLFGFLLIMAIFSSSGYLLQGLGEEKENRIMEVLLSSVSARQLLTGKVLGLGTAGLVQIVLWLLSSLLVVQLASDTIGGIFSQIQIPDNMILLGIIYFILGYFFFAILMAGIGAIGTTARESQQLSALVIVPAILPFYIYVYTLEIGVSRVIDTVLTLIPFCAPITVFMRLGISEIPLWELLLSIAIMIGSIFLGIILASKIFRTFLLMYGKRPGMKEILRSLRQS